MKIIAEMLLYSVEYRMKSKLQNLSSSMIPLITLDKKTFGTKILAPRSSTITESSITNYRETILTYSKESTGKQKMNSRPN